MHKLTKKGAVITAPFFVPAFCGMKYYWVCTNEGRKKHNICAPIDGYRGRIRVHILLG
jgi:hypothetical protein